MQFQQKKSRPRLNMGEPESSGLVFLSTQFFSYDFFDRSSTSGSRILMNS